MFIFRFVRDGYNPFAALRLSSPSATMNSTAGRASLSALLGLALALPLLMKLPRLAYKLRRRAQLPADYERVLVLGASGGIGRAAAHLYAARGARVCLVARRGDELRAAHDECVALSAKAGHAEYQAGGKRVISVEADVTNVEDMIRVRDMLETEWRGLDTMLVVAGVSALQPLLAIAGLERAGKAFVPPQAGVEDVARVVDVAAKATAGNFVGPLVAAVTMIPILSTTSPSPSILLLSSLAAAIPAPTRSLYCATKAASYTLYRALAQEHPGVSFSFVLPSTVEGAFRASAVDDPDAVAEKDPQAHGLKREAVARRCVRAVDEGAREVFMPRLMGLTPPLYWLAPTFIEWRARVKYNFVVE